MKKLSFLSFGILVLVFVGFFPLEEAFAAGRVVVYSSNQQAQNDLMATEFEKATGVKCEMVRLMPGVAMKRIKAEGGRPLGDVVMGMGKVFLVNNIDLWEPYKIKEFDKYPDEWKDPNGKWIVHVVHNCVVGYNTGLVTKAEAPKSWHDFLEPKWKDRFAWVNPNNSGSGYVQLTIFLHLFGEDESGWKKVETVLRHAKITEQSSLVYTGVSKGEFHAGLTNEYSSMRYKLSGAPVEVVYPNEGTASTADGAAIIKGAPNMENARKFLDWSCSMDWIKHEAKWLRRPARIDVNFSELMPGMIPTKQIEKIKGYDDAYWIKNQTEILKKCTDVLLRVK